MGRGIEWVIDIKLPNDKWITRVYKDEKEAVADMGFKYRQLQDMVRGRYKKCSEGVRVTKRTVIKV